jgi:hypothetical protein
MSKSTWTGVDGSDWNDPNNWSPAGVPGASSNVTIATGEAVASASIGTVNSITDSSHLSLDSAGTNTVTTFLDDAGHLWVDHGAREGGTTLNIGGTLTNSNRLIIGNTTLSASDEVSAAALDNMGRIYLIGSSSNQALLEVSSSAGFGTTGILSGYVRLAGDSAIEFASGEITSLAAGAHLGLVGNQAFIEDSTAPGSNSALTGLTSIGQGALFALHDGASVSTNGELTNDGQVCLDTGSGDGGSSLTVAGTLTNNRSLSIGNSALSASDEVTAASLDSTGRIFLTGSGANQALLDVTGSAGFGTSGVLTGSVYLTGDSAIEFASSEITSLAAHAQLQLNGSDAFIEDSTAQGSNSALTGLASIGARAFLDLENGASLSTTGALVNHGGIGVGGSSAVGSTLSIGGALTNTGTLGLGVASSITAASLDNTGFIELNGSDTSPALLDVTAGSAGFGTAGTVTGTVYLEGGSAIEFKGGQINTIAADSSRVLYFGDAFVEDSTARGSNSALTGLASIGAGADFGLEDGASLSTTGAMANDGNIGVGDVGAGSTLSISGALTNTGTLDIGDASSITATSLNSTGSIYLLGFFSGSSSQALLDVTAGAAGFSAAGVLDGNVQVADNSAIEFANGQISTIAAGSSLDLAGNEAFIEDSSVLGSNSALTGLADIAGTLFLEDQASVSTSGALVNSGLLGLDPFTGVVEGGSSLSIGGALTNTGTLEIGHNNLSATDSVTARSFVNSGTVDLIGHGTNLAALNVSGTTTNNDAISISSDTEEFAGAVDGAGSFSLSGANLRFDSSVSAGQTISETGQDALILKQAQNFAGTIMGFGKGDTIDATNFLASPATTFNFVENSGGTGGTLTLTDKSLGLTANILMTGVYSNSDFTLAPDSGTGTLVKFV